MRLLLVLLLLCVPVGVWGGDTKPKALDYIFKGTAHADGSKVGIRASTRKCGYYWYIDGGRQFVAFDGNTAAIEIGKSKKGKPYYDFLSLSDDGDVSDVSDTIYPEGSLMHDMFMASYRHCMASE